MLWPELIRLVEVYLAARFSGGWGSPPGNTFPLHTPAPSTCKSFFKFQ